ncbi:MAG: GspH/FimT family protein [bacterium]
MFKRIHNNREGVTMMEILVSISIIVIVLSLYTVNYRTANKRTQTILSAQKIVSDLRLAQSYAASAKRFNENIASNVWGVFFDKSNPSQYIIFNDINNDDTYDPSEKFRLIDLQPGISVYSLEYETSDGEEYSFSENQLSITFIPPDPEVRFYTDGDYVNDPIVSIVLRDDTNNSTKKVSVNFFGLVDVAE